MDDKYEVESDSKDKYEVECLARSIKEAAHAKANKPELYQKALASLKSEAKAINSIDDLKLAAKKLSDEADTSTDEADPDETDDEDDDEDE